MGKTPSQQVILPPEKDDAVGTAVEKLRLIPGKDPDKIKLQTPGHVKSEMARVYRAKLKGKVNPAIADDIITRNLVPILKATEIEQQFHLAAEDPDDDSPALTGLTISGPEVTLPDGVPARRLDGKARKAGKSTRRKGKTNGKGES